MKIKKIRYNPCSPKLNQKFCNSKTQYSIKENILIEIITDSMSGYGEISPLENFSTETTQEIQWGLEAFIQAIDYDFFLRSALLFNEKFHLISEPLVKYRVHADQLSHKNILKTLDFVEEIKKQVLEKLDTPLRSKYTQELKQYQKTKPVAKKSLELGMKIILLRRPS